MEQNKAHIGRRDLLLLMLGCGDNNLSDGVRGITRLQKLLFLLEREENLTASGDGFEFTAYKAGPYSSRLYDDLELLENLGMVKATVTSETTDPESVEIDMMSFEELMGDGAETLSDGRAVDGLAASDAYEEKAFELTPKGKEVVDKLLESDEYTPFVNGIRHVKSKYGHYSLNDLLYYVYTKYPAMTTESEIREQVLSRRRN